VFSVAQAVLFRSLPVSEPDRLVNLMIRLDDGLDPSFNYPLFADYRDRNDVFTGLVGYNLTALHLSTSSESERVRGLEVSGDYFDVLGVRTALGRGFLAEEDRVGAGAQVAVISHSLWQQRFGGRPDVLNQEIRLNGHRFTIVGVAPEGFTGNFRGLDAQVFIPITLYHVAHPDDTDAALSKRTFTWMQIVGRLSPGVTLQQAETRMRALAARIRAVEPTNTHPDLVLTPGGRGYTSFVDDLERPLHLLQLGVALVLAIACANVANLLIARAATRRRELAVRLALGSGRGRLVRQALTESTVLALLGGAAGLLVAGWLSRLLRSFRPTLEVTAGLDVPVLLFALGVTLATGLLFGVAPAWQAARAGVVAALKDERRTGGARRWNLRSGLVVAQVALSLVLLAAAGLTVKSLRALHGIDSGLDTEA
jgi:predicted permease